MTIHRIGGTVSASTVADIETAVKVSPGQGIRRITSFDTGNLIGIKVVNVNLAENFTILFGGLWDISAPQEPQEALNDASQLFSYSHE